MAEPAGWGQALKSHLLNNTPVSIRLYVYLGTFSGAIDRSFVLFCPQDISADTREANCFYLDGMLIWGGR